MLSHKHHNNNHNNHNNNNNTKKTSQLGVGLKHKKRKHGTNDDKVRTSVSQVAAAVVNALDVVLSHQHNNNNNNNNIEQLGVGGAGLKHKKRKHGTNDDTVRTSVGQVEADVVNVVLSHQHNKRKSEQLGGGGLKHKNRKKKQKHDNVQDTPVVEEDVRAQVDESDEVGEVDGEADGDGVEDVVGENGEPKASNHKYIQDNLLLFKYYQDIIKDKEDFAKFKQSLHSKLHTTFRIGGDDIISETFLHRMKNSPSFVALEKGMSVGGASVPPPTPITWYPDNNKAWKYLVSGEQIRRSSAFSHVHDFLVAASNSGDIWRQEEASMIPPCFLEANSNHKILDMCAAPGSKTAQIHDLVYGKRSEEIPAGCIVANDSNHKRCLLLSQRLSKTSSPHLLVTNHDAQHFPLKTGGMRLRFDRILCDVPCSGDGTLRKQPSKVWADWSPKSAFSLHSLQSAIVQRGLELLGLNGRLVYSTCSLNPVENEAVVSAVLQKFKGHVELMDASKIIPGLQRTKGLKTWRIMDENGSWYSKFKEVPKSLQDTILPSMFPQKGVDLSNCIRIFPHTQDTSGFFVAIFNITDLIENDKPPSPPAPKQGKRPSPPPRFASLWGDGPTNTHAEVTNAISDVYQINSEFPWRACFARKAEITEKKVKKVVLFSDSLRDILQHNKKDVINVVGGGVPAFERSTKEFSTHNNFRLFPSCLPFLVPFLGPKRVLTLIYPSDISTLITEQRRLYSDMIDPSAAQALRKMVAGYLVVKFALDSLARIHNQEQVVVEQPVVTTNKVQEKGKRNGKRNENEKKVMEHTLEKEKAEAFVVCRNGNGALSLCASSAEVWSLQFLLNCSSGE